MNRTIKFFSKNAVKSMTRQGIIPQGVKFWRIFYWLAGDSAKNQPKHVYPGYNTPASQAHRGIILRRVSLAVVSYVYSRSHRTKCSIQSPRSHIPRQVKLARVAYPGESVSPGCVTHDPRESNSHFLTHLHRPLKGQWHRNKCGLLFYY